MCRGLPHYLAETPYELYQRTGRIYSDEEEEEFRLAETPDELYQRTGRIFSDEEEEEFRLANLTVTVTTW